MSNPRASLKLGPRFNDAFLYAAEKHAAQTRKKTDVPYISHLMSVAALVLEAGGGEDEAVAALLHDVVEDCGGEPVLEEVRERFGDHVAKIVAGCTDAYTIPKPPWKQRKLDYLDVLRRAGDDIRLVSAADKLHNVRTIPCRLPQGGRRGLGPLQRTPRRYPLVLPRGPRRASGR